MTETNWGTYFDSKQAGSLSPVDVDLTELSLVETPRGSDVAAAMMYF